VSGPYKYTVDDSVLRFFTAAPRRCREELVRVFERLAADPFVKPDSVQPDATGRACHVNRFGAWLVTWWPEHLARELHILDVESLR